jgi:pyruvate/2-oxoglutarate dehydrogenase complex dihydrolipoamide dehydrogenase (E3) component
MKITQQRCCSSSILSYDLVVVGAGPAGTCGANIAATFGHRVALVEKEAQIGGAAINSGTVPRSPTTPAARHTPSANGLLSELPSGVL